MMLQVHWVLLHYRIVVRSVNYEIPLFDRNKYYREFFVDFFYQNISEITKFLAKTCLERWNCFHVSLPPSLNACYVKSGFKKNNKKKNSYHDLIYQQILHDFELPFLGLIFVPTPLIRHVLSMTTTHLFSGSGGVTNIPQHRFTKSMAPPFMSGFHLDSRNSLDSSLNLRTGSSWDETSNIFSIE